MLNLFRKQTSTPIQTISYIDELNHIARNHDVLDMDKLDQRLTFLERQTGHCLDWETGQPHVRPLTKDELNLQ